MFFYKREIPNGMSRIMFNQVFLIQQQRTTKETTTNVEGPELTACSGRAGRP